MQKSCAEPINTNKFGSPTAIGWLLLTIAPNQPVAVMRMLEFISKAVVALVVLATLWAAAPSMSRRSASTVAGEAEPVERRKLPVTVRRVH